MLWFLPSKTSHLKSINKSEENKDITLKSINKSKENLHLQGWPQARQAFPPPQPRRSSAQAGRRKVTELILIAKAVKWNWDLYPHNFRTNIMHLTVPFPSSPIWRRVWGSQQLDMRSQLENLPQPDQHHVDQHESHDIVKILSIIALVFY